MAGRYELFHLCPTMAYPAEVTTVWGGMLLSDMTTPYLEVFSSLPLMHLCHPPTNNEGCPSKCCPRSECTCAHPPSPVSAVARVGTPRVGAPRVGAPRVGTPRVGAPRVGAPRVGAPRIGAPRVGAPRVGAPELVPPGLVPPLIPTGYLWKRCLS